MGKSLEETQERVRVAEGRITEVDAKAAAAGESASKANRRREPKQRTGASRKSASTADARAEAIEGDNAQADLRDRAERRPRPVQARQGRTAGRRHRRRSTRWSAS